MTILRSRSVNPRQQLADATTTEHRRCDLGGIRLVGAGLNEGFQFLGLHVLRDLYRPWHSDP